MGELIIPFTADVVGAELRKMRPRVNIVASYVSGSSRSDEGGRLDGQRDSALVRLVARVG